MLAAFPRQSEMWMESMLGKLIFDGLDYIHNYLQFLVVLGRPFPKPSCDSSR